MGDSPDSEIQSQQSVDMEISTETPSAEKQIDTQTANLVDSLEHASDQEEATDTITEVQLREMYRNFWVKERVDPEGASRLITLAENYFPILQNALKLDEHYVLALDIVGAIGHTSYTTGVEALNEMRNKFVMQNLDVMVQAATKESKEKSDTDEARVVTIRNLESVISGGTDEQKELILRTMDTNLFDWVTRSNDLRVFQTYIKVMFREGSVEQTDNAANLAVSIHKNEEQSKQNGGLDMLKSYFEQFSVINPEPQPYIMQFKDPAYKHVTESLKKYIPHFEDFLARTVESGYESKHFNFVENVGTRLVDNLRTVLDIERERPGICQVLRNEFGIRNFFRYPPEVLIAQYDNRNNDTKKGVIVAALADYNGALSQESSKKAISDLFEQLTDRESLGEEYGVLVYEIGDTRELIRAIANGRRRSKNKKLSFGILMGHGSETTVELSSFLRTKPNRETILSQTAIQAPIGNAVAESFEKEASILFDSCSTGNGIVQEASKLGLRVSGPLRNTSLLSFSASKLEGRLDIEGNWESDKVTYQGGVKI